METVNASARYRWYVLWLLFVVNLLNYFDRNLIIILIEPIRHDLSFSDLQAGLLIGFAFGLVYAVMGVPIARFADGGRRVGVLGAALAFWSVMTTLCGAATSFLTMTLARLGVGIGEAGGLPTTHALVGAHFPPEKRGTAMSIVAVGGTLGLLLGMVAGGLMYQAYGWRSAFFIAGAPGVLVAILLVSTVREPKLSRAPRKEGAWREFVQALRVLWGRKSYVLLTAGLGVATIGAYGHQAFIPAFLIRSYELTPGQTGIYYGLASAPAALFGVLGGGLIVDRLAKKEARWSLWVMAISFGALIPVALTFFLIPGITDFAAQPLVIVALSIPIAMLGVIWTAPCFALIQNLAGDQLRATAAAVFMVITNIGLIVGPAIAGGISDALAPSVGEDSLRYALAIVTAPFAVAVVLFLIGAKYVKRDLAEAGALAAAQAAEKPDASGMSAAAPAGA